MDERNRVLSPANGPLHAQLMFVGEAPGRLGADTTQIPFHGDKAGDNFERLLSQVGLSRYDCFVTNAILCNPRDEGGNNAPPSKVEISNCANFLRQQIEIINPRIVVTLGANSLHALDVIEPHGLKLSESVRRAVSWNNRILIPLYHPGQRAMIHRSFLNQLADYQFVAEAHRRNQKKGGQRKSAGKVDEIVRYCARSLIRRAGQLPYFRLHKLYYLIEYTHFKATGNRLSRAYIIRQKDGPYVTDLHAGSLRRSMLDLDVRQSGAELVLRLRDAEADMFSPVEAASERNKKLDAIIDDVWRKYGSVNNEQLKTAVYLTSPMRALLRAEKYSKQSTFNRPVEFG
jgi:uracil-DNA glycosylase family 4